MLHKTYISDKPLSNQDTETDIAGMYGIQLIWYFVVGLSKVDDCDGIRRVRIPVLAPSSRQQTGCPLHRHAHHPLQSGLDRKQDEQFLPRKIINQSQFVVKLK